jgi:hypothetical protein
MKQSDVLFTDDYIRENYPQDDTLYMSVLDLILSYYGRGLENAVYQYTMGHHIYRNWDLSYPKNIGSLNERAGWFGDTCQVMVRKNPHNPHATDILFYRPESPVWQSIAHEYKDWSKQDGK